MPRFLVFCAFFAAVFAPEPAAAQNVHIPSLITPFDMPSARAASLGGYPAAFASDFDALFSNPALLYGLDAQLSLADISFELLDFGMVGVVLNYLADISVETSIALLREGIENAFLIGGPLSLGFVKDGWGVGVFNATRMRVIWTADEILRPQLTITEEFFLVAARSFRLAETGAFALDAGLALKAFWRGGHIMSLWLQDVKYFLENSRNNIFERQAGGGADVGFALRLPRVTLAVALRDPFSPAAVTQYRNWQDYKDGAELAGGFARVRPRAAIGFSARPEAPFWQAVITRFVFTLDWGQALFFLEDAPRNPLLDMSAAFEVCLIDRFSFRMAVSEMLPATGMGFRFGLLAIDLAARMRETGRSVWEHPAFSLNINFLYRYDWPF